MMRISALAASLAVLLASTAGASPDVTDAAGEGKTDEIPHGARVWDVVRPVGDFFCYGKRARG